MIPIGTTTAGHHPSAITGATPGITAGVEIIITGTCLIVAAAGEWDYLMAGARAGTVTMDTAVTATPELLS
jgi:hypothetical protein